MPEQPNVNLQLALLGATAARTMLKRTNRGANTRCIDAPTMISYGNDRSKLLEPDQN